MNKKIVIFLSLLIFNLNSLTVANSIEPDIFVQSTVNRAADTLGGSLSKEQRIEELKKIAQDTVDITGIGFYSLGKHRKSMSEERLSWVPPVTCYCANCVSICSVAWRRECQMCDGRVATLCDA